MWQPLSQYLGPAWLGPHISLSRNMGEYILAIVLMPLDSFQLTPFFHSASPPHLLSVIKKVTALLEYQGVLPFQGVLSFLKRIYNPFCVTWLKIDVYVKLLFNYSPYLSPWHAHLNVPYPFLLIFISFSRCHKKEQKYEKICAIVCLRERKFSYLWM